MVRKKNLLRVNNRKTIRRSFPRFVSLMVMSFLGEFVFAGLMATAPDMIKTLDDRLDSGNVYDISLMSTQGLTTADLDAVKAMGPAAAEGLKSLDVVARWQDEDQDKDTVIKVTSLPKDLNQITLLSGRMPEKAGEILVEENMLSVEGLALGDTVTLDDEKFADQEVAIVGTVDSPLYYNCVTIGQNRGNTGVGSGKISYYAYGPEENFDFDYFTSIDLTVAGADEFVTSYPDYVALVDDMMDRLEAIKEDREQARFQELYDEAAGEIADKEAEGQQELDDAWEELLDAKTKLSDGEVELADARKELDDAWEELSDAKKTLDDGAKKLKDGKKQLDSAKKEIDDGEQELTALKAKLDSGAKELADNRKGLDSAAAELSASKQTIDASWAELESGKGQLDYLAIQLQANEAYAGTPFYEGMKAQYEAGMALYNENLVKYNAGLAAYEEGYAQYSAGEEAFAAAQAQYDAGLAAYEAGRKSLDSGKKKYQESLSKYNKSVADYEKGKADYEKGLKEYNDGEAEYADKYQEYEDGLKEYEDGLAEYEDAKDEFDTKLADAREELSDLKVGTWYIDDRTGDSTYTDYIDDSNSIRNLGRIFPVVFFAVAVLVSLISMNRMVEEDRLEIGTLKSLGFNDARIMGKYLHFSLLATLIGGALGGAMGLYIIPKMIFGIYKILFTLPPLTLTLQPAYTLLGFAFTIICVCGTSLWTAHRVLKEKSSELMRPKAPKNGKRILLERWHFFWSRLSFSRKVTVRNIFRYKKRVLVTIGGIAGCTALMLTGFGIKDSIVDIPSAQYYQVYQFDGTAYVSEFDQADFADIPEIDQATQAQRITAEFGDVEGFIQVVRNQEEMNRIAKLCDDRTGEILPLVPGQVIINEKLSSMSGLGVGDTIVAVDVNNVRYEMTISGVAKNYIEHFAYMDVETFESYGQEYKPNLAYFTVKRDGATQENSSTELGDMVDLDALAETILSKDNILSMSYRSSLIENVGNSLKSLNQVVLILIVLAAMLAFVVLYNLSNININERRREIATLKVLGFYNDEVDRYITKETLIITAVGIILGLLAGIVLSHVVVSTIEVEKCRFINQLRPMSFVYSAAMSAIFTLIVNFITHFHLKGINMIDSLKSVE